MRWMIYAIAGISVAASAVQAAPKKYFQTTRELQRQWLVLEEECRGGQHTPDDAICRERNRIEKELERRGICWAYSDLNVPPYKYGWHPCYRTRP